MRIASEPQLPLELPFDPALDRDSFIVGAPNEEAVTFLERFPDWPSHVALLTGPQGSGKSHLASLWARDSGARTVPGRWLGSEPPARLLASGALLLDPLHPTDVDEAALFHLLNAARENGHALLVVARENPASWMLKTRDVVSRLRAAPEVAIRAPDDELLRHLLVKLFADRQLAPDPCVLKTILLRMERSFEDAQRIVADLDRASLATGRGVTRNLAARLLENRDNQLILGL